jgi:outer membrane lipoprotein-sorting protein
VTGLTDVFALVSRATDSFQTLRATTRHWRDEERYMEAWDRHVEARSSAGGTLSIVLGAGSDELQPTTSEATVRLWLERPSRFREEYEGAWGDQTAVSDGEHLWRRVPRLGMLREGASKGQGVLFASQLVNPAPLLPGLELELLGHAEQAGRSALRLRAAPRHVSWHDLFGLAPGADGYELLVDAERGILLRAEAFLEGTTFAWSEVVEVAFDEKLLPETFVLEPAPGESVRTPEELAHDFPEDVTLDEAARRASFTVWVPRKLGRGWEINASYARGEPGPLDRETVMIHYWHGKQGQLNINETALDDERGASWELVERSGQAFRVWQQPGRRRMPIIVRFHKGDTSIELQSDDFELERLLEVANSCAPVSGERPRFFRE